jgi:hypothetical protein
MNIFFFTTPLLTIAVGIFVIVAKEKLYKKLIVIALFILSIILSFTATHVYVVLFGILMQMVLLILMLIYYRNRGVI